MSVTCPASTGARNTSCWLLLNLCISSQKMIVFRPVRRASFFASSNNLLHSPTPLDVLLISTKRQPAVCAISRAIVVFPVPGPPHRIIEGTRSATIRPRSTPFGPTSSCPATSSSDVGRIRSASGAWLFFNFFVFCSCGSRRPSSEVGRLVPLAGWVEKDGGGRGFVVGVCCVLLYSLTSGDEPA